uniref:Lipoprotein n=1 Tax=uncultured bacterium fosmid pJB69A5 TaxID=1478067 RepID=A0A0H3U9S1_9BACT|nr:hypothetical protein [uncultured bacterium fosmid pJB69A5]
MKKILLFACAAVFAFASCGNKTAAPAGEGDSTAVEAVVSETVESAIADVNAALETGDVSKVQTVLATLQATYAQLVKEGKLEDAKVYASKIQEFVTEHSEDIQKIASGDATISSLINGIKNLPTSAETTAEEAAAAVQSDALSLVDAAKAAAQTAVEEKVNEAKDAAVQKATEAIAPAAQKAAEAKANVDAAKAKAEEKQAQAQATVDAAKKLLGK